MFMDTFYKLCKCQANTRCSSSLVVWFYRNPKPQFGFSWLEFTAVQQTLLSIFLVWDSMLSSAEVTRRKGHSLLRSSGIDGLIGQPILPSLRSFLLSVPFRWTSVCLCVLSAGECVWSIRALEAAPEPPVPVRGGHGEAPHTVHQPYLHLVPPAWWDPCWLLCGHCLPKQLPHQHLTGEQSLVPSGGLLFYFLIFFHSPTFS